MHFYYNKLLPNHFDDDSFQSAQFIPIPEDDQPLTASLFLFRVNYSSRKCSFTFVGPKVWSLIPDNIKSSTTPTLKWKLKKHLYEK